MKAAFSTWNERIAPVFDVARQVHVVDLEPDDPCAPGVSVEWPEERLVRKTLRLTELGVSVLVCGAISRAAESMVLAHGIQVIAFVSGDLQSVVQGWRSGTLERDSFAMPGCRRGRRRGAGRGCGRRGSGIGREPKANKNITN